MKKIILSMLVVATLLNIGCGKARLGSSEPSGTNAIKTNEGGTDEDSGRSDDEGGVIITDGNNEVKTCSGVIVVSTALNVRSSPEILPDNLCGLLMDGDEVRVIASGLEERFVSLVSDMCEDNDQRAYVSSRFVELGDDCSRE